ncbi:MAG: carboxypeptidase regulatory-like domain-containing protein [Candidatus Aminicenantes bacterium]|nr:carboxypeptidase regulatory-like domain-containing protein [Candidatus Aminicenantes bacterium]
MSKRAFFLTVVLLIAGLAFAQTQTGNIVGRVLAPEGEGLPGVSVTLTSPAMIIPSMSAITGERGAFRFVALSPGDYQITFVLSGMKTVIRKGVKVEVSRTATLDITMEVKSLEENVTVVGQSPTIDKQRTARPVNLDKMFLQSLPAPRNLGTFVNMAPGIADNSAYGSSTMDNSYLLDGVNLVDAATGTQSVGFGLDIMEEIAIQAGGLSAEYGSVRGAMINVVTKSGGNKFSGSGSFYFNQEKLKSVNTHGTPLAGSKSGNKMEIEPVFTLGGPIIKDKLWFFMNASFIQTEAFVAGYPAGVTPGNEKPFKTMLPYPYLKLSFQPGPNDKFMLSYNYSDRITDDRGASKFSAESVTIKQTSPSHVFNAQWTKFFGSNFFANMRFGMVLYQLLLNAKGSEAQRTDQNTSISTGNAWRNHDLYTRNRFQFNTDATAFIDNLAGTHELKFGGEIQYAHTTWDVYGVSDPLTGGCSIAMYGSTYYRALTLRGNGFNRADNVVDYAGFVQDNWAITRNLNLSLGLRLEYNSVVYPAQNTTEGPIAFLGKTYNRSIPESLTMYKWMDLAPRVGLIYDLFSDGKTLFKASYSRYILPNQVGWINLAHPNGWFGYYQYLNPDGSALMNPDGTPKVTLWAMPGGFQNGGAQIGYKDYKLKAGHTDELAIGMERELFTDFSLGARYIKKWDRDQPNMIDAAQLDADKLMSTGEIDYSKNWTSKTVVDPYNGQTLTYYEKINLTASQIYIVNPPGADRNYSGFEFTINKRFSKGWALDVSYVYAKSTGLITTGRADESLGGAVGGFYQSPNAHTNANGTLPLERRHQFKVEGLMKGPFGINLSGYFRYLSGLPVTRTVSNNYLGLSLKENITIYAETRGHTYLPPVVQLDLRLEKTIKISTLNIGVFADCFNLFNRGVATGMWMNSSNVATNKYKQMTSINDPRIFQLGVRIQY